MTHCAVSSFFRTPHDKYGREREDVSTQGQSPFHRSLGPNDSNGYTLYAIKWVKLGCTSPEMRIVLLYETELIQGHSVFWREVPSHSADDSQVLRGQLGIVFHMIVLLAVTRNIKAQYIDTGRGFELECFERLAIRLMGYFSA